MPVEGVTFTFLLLQRQSPKDSQTQSEITQNKGADIWETTQTPMLRCNHTSCWQLREKRRLPGGRAGVHRWSSLSFSFTDGPNHTYFILPCPIAAKSAWVCLPVWRVYCRLKTGVCSSLKVPSPGPGLTRAAAQEVWQNGFYQKMSTSHQSIIPLRPKWKLQGKHMPTGMCTLLKPQREDHANETQNGCSGWGWNFV